MKKILTCLLTLILFICVIKHQSKLLEKSHTVSISKKHKTKLHKEKMIPAHFDVLVVGAGLSGAVISERHASQGDSVLIIDKRSHVAGNCYDYIDERTGIRVSKYGAHLFHTIHKEVWEYVNLFTDWQRFDHKVLGFIDGKYVPIPVNINTVNALFNASIETTEEMDDWLRSTQIHLPPGQNPKNSEEMALSRVGRDLYEKIFKPYTKKQWETDPVNLDASVTGRIPIRNNFDDRYFADRFQALPSQGYTHFVESLLKSPKITVMLNQDYFELPFETKQSVKKIYYTGPIDKFFGENGSLEYRSLRFERIEHMNHIGQVLPSPVVNYPSTDFPYTRVIEYKQMLNQISPHTVLFREYPSSTGEPYYPVPTKANRDVYMQLHKKTKLIANTTFVGRLANYKYFNMDEAILNALRTFRRETRTAHIITAKFNENMDWLSKICNGLEDIKTSWFIYLKNPDESVDSVLEHTKKLLQNLPCNVVNISVIDHRTNVGREGLAWLDYLLSNNTKQGHVHAFLQGSIEAPIHTVVEYISKTIYSLESPRFYEPFYGVQCGKHTDLRLDFFGKEFDYIVKKKLKLDNFCWTYRAEFAVSNTGIQSFVQKHMQLVTEDIIPALQLSNDPPMGHVLERIWMALFNEKI